MILKKGCRAGGVRVREKECRSCRYRYSLAGVAEINRQIAVEKKAGTVYSIHGHLPVFHHREEDVQGFGMFIRQMIVHGTVKPKEIVRAFGVPMVTVKRYAKVLRERRAEGFYIAKPRHSSASVLKGEVLERAQQLLNKGRACRK